MSFMKENFFCYSSDVDVISGQNLHAKVTYYTPKPSRIGHSKYEILPAKGEVQERFNPRPYFDYLHVSSKPETKPSSVSDSSILYATPYKSVPSYNNPPKNSEVDAKPSDFDSPVYTPDSDLKPIKEYNSKPPANSDINSPMDYENKMNPSEYDSKPNDFTVDSYGVPYDSGTKDKDHVPYSPPQSSYSNPIKNVYDSYQANNPSQMETSPSKPSMTDDKSKYPSFPYLPAEMDHPPKNLDTSMHPPPPHYGEVSDMEPHIVKTVKPPQSVQHNYHDSPPSDYYQSQVEDHPPIHAQVPAPVDYGKGPEYGPNIHHEHDHGYNYDEHYHFDHHIYKEVTTTTEAPEDERLNKGQYSYYYLGRKLWYIPLYFSIYFIIYIGILILKSIARHKVSVFQDFQDKTRKSRNLELNNTMENVTRAIDISRQKFM